MTTSPNDTNSMPPSTLLQTYTLALKKFTTSSLPFQIIHSIPTPPSTLKPTTPLSLYILDSSFNPPTLAHQRIALNALLHDPVSSPPSQRKRLLLLLSIQNADKAPKPAGFAQRLGMMHIFAEELLSTLKSAQSQSKPSEIQAQEGREGQEQMGEEEIAIDIALTTHPYFVDKSLSITSSSLYPTKTTQIHLVGYDTLIRILDPKYYPPGHTLKSIRPFLREHRLLVTYRADSEWGGREEQDGYLRSIGEGKREDEGAEKEWVREGRIKLVEGRGVGEEVVSSTRVRGAVRDGDTELLGKLVTEGVKDWVLEEKLYLEE